MPPNAEINTSSSVTATVSDCDLQQMGGTYPGTNNINAGPMLSPTFHLNAGSPCIGKGNSVAEPATDLAGAARGGTAGWDIGAYNP